MEPRTVREDPMHPNNEFRRGDFGDLKNLDLDRRSVKDLTRNPDGYRHFKEWVEEVTEKKGEADVERLISELVDQYV
jgi:hypothetical protein